MLRNNMSRLLNMLEALALSEAAEEMVLQVYLKSGLWANADSSNVPIHCATVAKVAMNLGTLVRLQDAEMNTLLIASLIHDARKAHERSAISHMNDGSREKSVAFTTAATKQVTWLTRLGDEYADVIHLTGLSGHSSLAYFLEEDRPLPEKIFHVADDLCGGPYDCKVVMVEDRISELKSGYRWLECEHRGELGGKSWIEVQSELAARILDELAAGTCYNTGFELNRWLVQFCN